MKRNNLIKAFGFSLVELMIAVFVSLIVLLGLISVFETSANMNRTQNGLARLQENGRYAIMHIKQNLEQAGYQSCLSSSISGESVELSPRKLPWQIHTNGTTGISGIPERNQVFMSGSIDAFPKPYLFDPAYLIHGHECSAGACQPSLTTIGSDFSSSFTMPALGKADGERLAGNDVISFRYIRSNGYQITNIAGTNITFVNNTGSIPEFGDHLLLAKCDGNATPPSLVNINSVTTNSVSIATNGFFFDPQVDQRIFGIKNDIVQMTYYVANKVVDGRDIPTLYNVVNGVTNAIVEGVDKFDIIYGVQTSDGLVRYLDANGVQNLSTSLCHQPPIKVADITGEMINGVGCGWRSVVSAEVHLLLNTVANASPSDKEQFYYSLDGVDAKNPSDLLSGIKHYNLLRKEFMANISIKNN
jgi:type IV pilus assembly protein PilW